jgi:hypothetical protein
MASRRRCSRLGDVDIVAARGPRGDEDHRRRRSRPDPLSRHVGGINMGKWYSRLTDVVIKENGGASWMQILEPSKVVNLTVDYDPLKGARMDVWLISVQRVDSYEVTVFVVFRDVVASEFLKLFRRCHCFNHWGLKRERARTAIALLHLRTGTRMTTVAIPRM